MKKLILSAVAIAMLTVTGASASANKYWTQNDESKLTPEELSIAKAVKRLFNKFNEIDGSYIKKLPHNREPIDDYLTVEEEQVSVIIDTFQARKEFLSLVRPRAHKYPEVQRAVDYIMELPIVNTYCAAGLLSKNTQMINTCYDHVNELEPGGYGRFFVLEMLVTGLVNNNEIAKAEEVAFKALLEHSSNIEILYDLYRVYMKDGYKLKFKDKNEKGIFAYLLLQKSAKLGYGPAIKDLGSDIVDVQGQNFEKLLSKYAKSLKIKKGFLIPVYDREKGNFVLKEWQKKQGYLK